MLLKKRNKIAARRSTRKGETFKSLRRAFLIKISREIKKNFFNLDANGMWVKKEEKGKFMFGKKLFWKVKDQEKELKKVRNKN